MEPYYYADWENVALLDIKKSLRKLYVLFSEGFSIYKRHLRRKGICCLSL